MIRPHTRQSWNPLSGNAKIRASANEHSFQPPNVINCTERFAAGVLRLKAAQLKNWIRHELPRPMKSHIPATITLEEFNPALDEGFGRSQHVHGFCVSSEGDNRCVLQ